MTPQINLPVRYEKALTTHCGCAARSFKTRPITRIILRDLFCKGRTFGAAFAE
jgi:hypothetical protein